jgi:hypothetical protein
MTDRICWLCGSHHGEIVYSGPPEGQDGDLVPLHLCKRCITTGKHLGGRRFYTQVRAGEGVTVDIRVSRLSS